MTLNITITNLGEFIQRSSSTFIDVIQTKIDSREFNNV